LRLVFCPLGIRNCFFLAVCSLFRITQCEVLSSLFWLLLVSPRLSPFLYDRGPAFPFLAGCCLTAYLLLSMTKCPLQLPPFVSRWLLNATGGYLSGCPFLHLRRPLGIRLFLVFFLSFYSPSSLTSYLILHLFFFDLHCTSAGCL